MSLVYQDHQTEEICFHPLLLFSHLIFSFSAWFMMPRILVLGKGHLLLYAPFQVTHCNFAIITRTVLAHSWICHIRKEQKIAGNVESVCRQSENEPNVTSSFGTNSSWVPWAWSWVWKSTNGFECFNRTLAEQDEFGGYTHSQHIKFCSLLCCYKDWVTWMQVAKFV